MFSVSTVLREPDGHGDSGVLADHGDVVGGDQAAGVTLAAVVDEVGRRSHRVEQLVGLRLHVRVQHLHLHTAQSPQPHSVSLAFSYTTTQFRSVTQGI